MTVVAVLILGAFPIHTSALILNSTGAIDSADGTASSFLAFGKVGGVNEQGMSYKPGASHNICAVDFMVRANTSVAVDSLRLDVRLIGPASSATTTTGGTSLSSQGSFVATANSQIQVGETSFTQRTFTFSPCLVVVGAYWYNFIITRSGSASSSL